MVPLFTEPVCLCNNCMSPVFMFGAVTIKNQLYWLLGIILLRLIFIDNFVWPFSQTFSHQIKLPLFKRKAMKKNCNNGKTQLCSCLKLKSWDFLVYCKCSIPEISCATRDQLEVALGKQN